VWYGIRVGSAERCRRAWRGRAAWRGDHGTRRRNDECTAKQRRRREKTTSLRRAGPSRQLRARIFPAPGALVRERKINKTAREVICTRRNANDGLAGYGLDGGRIEAEGAKGRRPFARARPRTGSPKATANATSTAASLPRSCPTSPLLLLAIVALLQSAHHGLAERYYQDRAAGQLGPHSHFQQPELRGGAQGPERRDRVCTHGR